MTDESLGVELQDAKSEMRILEWSAMMIAFPMRSASTHREEYRSYE